MSETHPELLFVGGPQVGQRVELTQPTAVLGRSGDAEIMLSEEFVSRRHIRYELLNAGPTIENLSAKGTWINGKRFKRGKKVLLETGDLVGVGNETQLLFIGAGDDSAQAVDRFGPAARGKDAFGRKVTPPKAAPAEAPSPPESEEVEAEKGTTGKTAREVKKASEMTPGERAEAERQAKRRKLLIGVGVWWGVMLLAVAAGVAYKNSRGNGGPEVDEGKILTPKEIGNALGRPLDKTTANENEMGRHLAEALRLRKEYGGDVWKLHKIIHEFKLALSYTRKRGFETGDQAAYTDSIEELAKEFSARYRQACLLEKNQEWRRAVTEFKELLQLLSEANDEDPIFRNVQYHLSRVKHHYQKMLKSKENKGLYG